MTTVSESLFCLKWLGGFYWPAVPSAMLQRAGQIHFWVSKEGYQAGLR